VPADGLGGGLGVVLWRRLLTVQCPPGLCRLICGPSAIGHPGYAAARFALTPCDAVSGIVGCGCSARRWSAAYTIH
jgi:hypothetical protein